jgi:hypothetical protein
MRLHLMRLRLAALGALPLLTPLAAAGTSPGDEQSPQAQQVVPAPGTGPNAGTSVIRPPAGIDPGINKARPETDAPETFPMPVVPPPGSPGGNPNVVPR